jgi:hypothetical protein
VNIWNVSLFLDRERCETQKLCNLGLRKINTYFPYRKISSFLNNKSVLGIEARQKLILSHLQASIKNKTEQHSDVFHPTLKSSVQCRIVLILPKIFR